MEPLKKYSRQDVKNRDTTNIWIIIENKVYDVTNFLNEHPGGEEVILEGAGEDCTDAFNEVPHSSEAKEMLPKYLIGELIDSEKTVKKSCPKVLWKKRPRVAPLVLAGLVVGAFVAFRIYQSSSK